MTAFQKRTLPLLPFLAAALVMACAIGLATTPEAATAADNLDFASDVYPILEEACVRCHGSKENFSNLRLDSPEAILKGGDLGKVLEPGKPDDSSLFVRVALSDDDLDLMPVEGDRLDEDQQEILRLWIEQGADFGDWTGAGG